ncbi:MAG: ABC transporter ATP-binding protein [Deltaproteobacteria bacterium]|nr:MAG: ABC transporter ATP-binding protein [Deltaproteobacteria bacterium]
MKNAVDSLGTDWGRTKESVFFLLLFAFLHALFRYGGRLGFLLASRDIEGAVREEFFRGIIRARVDEVRDFSSGDLLARGTSDVSSFWLFIGPGLLTLVSAGFTFLIGIFFMVKISAKLTLILLSAIPPVVFVARVFARRLYRGHRRVRELVGKVSEVASSSVTGIRVIRSYLMEETLEERFSRISGDLRDAVVSTQSMSALFHGTLTLATGVGTLFLIFIGGRDVLSGDLTVGGFVAFVSYIGMLSFPSIALGWVLNLFQRAKASLSRMEEVTALAGIEERGEGASPHGRIETLEVRNLSFSYLENSRPVLRGVSFSLRRGEVVGLAGETGSGKTTLVAILLGFLRPDEGEILVNGRRVREEEWPWIRERIRAVFQDPFLFSETVFSNISFPVDDPRPERVVASAVTASIHDEIESFPEGYGTLVGERGITLSGGQKQRMTIARALLPDWDILVLDDAFASVDSLAEERIFSSLLDLLGDRTLLVVSQRVQTLSRCHRILVLHEGRIVEEGTFGELIQRGGIFSLHYEREKIREGLS